MRKAAIFDLDETLRDHGSSTRHFAKDQHQRLLGETSIDSFRFIDVFVELDAYGLTPRPDLLKALVH